MASLIRTALAKRIIDMAIGNGTGIAANGTGIPGTADTIGQGNFELLTGARMAGRR
jgi:hypothetical protein